MDIKLLINPGEPETLYQWDTDRQMEITDTEGLSIDEVHFSNTILTKALVVEPTVSEAGYVANIPNSLLKVPMMIKAYVVAQTENGKHVTFCEQFEVNKRTKPSDYVYTETEVKRYEDLENRIKTLEDNPVSEETIGKSIGEYLEKNPVEIEVDKELSETSENAVANKAVAKKIAEVANAIPKDYVSTEELEKKGYLTEHQSLDDYAKKNELPTELPASDVYTWAKQPTKPSYTASEVKALPDTTQIPTKLPNPQKLTFDGAVSAEYDGSGAVVVTIPKGTERIEKGAVDTDVTLEPNKLYIFPEMATLNITLSEDVDQSIVNEYHFVFQSGATATTLVLPDTISMPDGFSVDANKIYEISILETMMLAQSWAVNA